MPRLPTRISITGLAIVVFLSAASSAAAQADRGTITGTVTDSSGGVVASASVKAIHVATNFERTVTTSARISARRLRPRSSASFIASGFAA